MIKCLYYHEKLKKKLKRSFITGNCTRKHRKASKRHDHIFFLFLFFFSLQIFCIYRTLVNCTVCENAKHLEFVDKCPRNIYEFTIAAKRKQSEYVPDDCPERNTHPLVYHCVIHAKLLKLVEVCARVWISQGKTDINNSILMYLFLENHY